MSAEASGAIGANPGFMPFIPLERVAEYQRDDVGITFTSLEAKRQAGRTEPSPGESVLSRLVATLLRPIKAVMDWVRELLGCTPGEAPQACRRILTPAQESERLERSLRDLEIAQELRTITLENDSFDLKLLRLKTGLEGLVLHTAEFTFHARLVQLLEEVKGVISSMPSQDGGQVVRQLNNLGERAVGLLAEYGQLKPAKDEMSYV